MDRDLRRGLSLHPDLGLHDRFDETLNQPEIVVFDIPRKGASELLWTTFERLKSGELVLDDGALLDPADPMPFTWRKVHPSQVAEGEWLTLAKWRRFERTGQAVGLEAFQMVLPDGEGRLPWQEGYDERLRPRQPALWLPFESGEPPLAASSGV